MITKLILWISVAWLCSTIIRILISLDLNKVAYNHVPGPCRHVAGVVNGSEDIELIHDEGIAFITSGVVYMQPHRHSKVKGKIFLYDFKSELNKKLFKADEMIIEGKNFDASSFYPHGISSYVSKGRILLYVISHGPKGDTVEVFVYNKANPNKLTHTKTIRDPLIYAANDLVVVGADKFFLGNDHYFNNKPMMMLERLLQLPLCNLVFYDGAKTSVVESWLVDANGLAVDAKMEHLYLAMPMAETIRVYDLSRDLKIKQRTEISLLSSPDNLFVDRETSSLWVGAHPVVYKVVKYLDHPDDPAVTAPSQVLKVKMGEDYKSWVITEPFSDDGSLLAGSSVAVFYDKQLLIGTVYRQLLHCDVLNPEII